MTDLTERQKQLLKAIIEFYVKTGEPVASELIEKSCDLGISPATIRNEMVKLTDLGFLKQPHVSAGRVPTTLGFRLYINTLMQEKEVPVLDEVALKQQLLDQRVEFGKMIQVATRALAKKCDTLALSLTDGNLYYAGAANILDIPEFFDIDVTRFVLSMFDELPILEQIISKAQGSDPLHIIFGEETDFESLASTSFAFLNFENRHNHQGIIGVIGPNRLNFPVVLPYLRYVGRILNEVGVVI
jgi:heat-inducible transcriptional repressor